MNDYTPIEGAFALQRAIEIACVAHSKQKDLRGEIYLKHPMHVAARLPYEHTSLMCAAWLHDVVEDTSESENPITLVTLAECGFSNTVLDLVDALTRRPDEAYDDFIVRIIATSTGAVAIKLCDIAENLRQDRAVFGRSAEDRRLRYRHAQAALMRKLEVEDLSLLRELRLT